MQTKTAINCTLSLNKIQLIWEVKNGLNCKESKKQFSSVEREFHSNQPIITAPMWHHQEALQTHFQTCTRALAFYRHYLKNVHLPKQGQTLKGLEPACIFIHSLCDLLVCAELRIVVGNSLVNSQHVNGHLLCRHICITIVGLYLIL